MNRYCWAATIVCMTGTALNVKRLDQCFFFWIAGEIMWALYDIRCRLWSRLTLDVIGLGFAVAGAIVNF